LLQQAKYYCTLHQQLLSNYKTEWPIHSIIRNTAILVAYEGCLLMINTTTDGIQMTQTF